MSRDGIKMAIGWVIAGFLVIATAIAVRRLGFFISSRVDSSIFSQNFDKYRRKRRSEMKKPCSVKVAIIGAGVGGTSAAYFLNDLMEDRVEIHVYSDGKVGGRTAVVEFDGHLYEAGATIIHENNMYLVEFAKKFGLTRVPKSFEGIFGIFDGCKFLFRSSSNGILTAVRMLWRYGLSLLRLSISVNHDFGKFLNIYHHQSKGHAFKTVPEMLQTMGDEFHHMTQVTARDYFEKELGLNKQTVDELVTSAVTVIYDQNSRVNACVAMASLAGVQTKSLWSVLGGNFLIPQECLKESGAQFHAAQVTTVEKKTQSDSNGSVEYTLTYSSPGVDGDEETAVYDAVILAAPLYNCGIKFEGFDKPIYTKTSTQPYHQTIATFVKGQIDPTFFGELSINRSFPITILTNGIDNPDVKISSYVIPVPVTTEEKKLSEFRRPNSDEQTRVWKVFSNSPLSPEDISKVFKSHDVVQANVWRAYPDYCPPQDFTPFVLDDSKLFYVNCIEKVTSAMEMSVIAAKNCVLLLDRAT